MSSVGAITANVSDPTLPVTTTYALTHTLHKWIRSSDAI